MMGKRRGNETEFIYPPCPPPPSPAHYLSSLPPIYFFISPTSVAKTPRSLSAFIICARDDITLLPSPTKYTSTCCCGLAPYPLPAPSPSHTTLIQNYPGTKEAPAQLRDPCRGQLSYAQSTRTGRAQRVWTGRYARSYIWTGSVPLKHCKLHADFPRRRQETPYYSDPAIADQS